MRRVTVIVMAALVVIAGGVYLSAVIVPPLDTRYAYEPSMHPERELVTAAAFLAGALLTAGVLALAYEGWRHVVKR